MYKYILETKNKKIRTKEDELYETESEFFFQ